VPISRELVSDAPNAAQQVERLLGVALGQEIDRVAGYGSQAPDIEGAGRAVKSTLDRLAEKARRGARLRIVGGNPNASSGPARGAPELVV